LVHFNLIFDGGGSMKLIKEFSWHYSVFDFSWQRLHFYENNPKTPHKVDEPTYYLYIFPGIIPAVFIEIIYIVIRFGYHTRS